MSQFIKIGDVVYNKSTIRLVKCDNEMCDMIAEVIPTGRRMGRESQYMSSKDDHLVARYYAGSSGYRDLKAFHDSISQ